MLQIKNLFLSVIAILMATSKLLATAPADWDIQQLPTYFSYTEQEVAPLYRLSTPQEMNRDELSRWDKTVYHLIYQNHQEDNASRIYAYLYTAQRDAAYLSYQVKKRFEGSFDPVSRQILYLFFPKFAEKEQSNESNSDAYSNLLADIVVAKVKKRMAEDQQGTRLYEQKKGDSYWLGQKPFIGQDTGSWKTWFLTSGGQFRLPPPPPYPSLFWNEQLQQVMHACRHITPEQKKSILFWAGISSGPTSWDQVGDWRKIANDYMWNQDVPLAFLLLVRSTLAMGLADAAIAVFDSKYTYWVKRPSMMDKNIMTHLDNPNHPSYPSGHSTIASAAATILTYFLPQAKNLWHNLAQESGHSRIWCGIHFPIDNEMGMKLGKKVGDAAIEKVEKSIQTEHKDQIPAAVEF